MSDSEASERTEEVERPGRGRGSGGRSSGRGQSSGRQGSRGRGRGKSKSKERVQKSDEHRVRERTQEKKEKMKAVVLEMDTDKLREMVLMLIDREPALVFDLCEGVEEPGPPPPQPPTQASPSWCKCTRCREMPTELERKCCGCLPRKCISTRNELEDLCLNPQVLAIGQRYYREMLGRYNQHVDDCQKMMRHSAYRNFVLWRHGNLALG